MCWLGIRPISERHMGHVVQMDQSERGIRHLGIWGLGPSVARPGDWEGSRGQRSYKTPHVYGTQFLLFSDFKILHISWSAVRPNKAKM